MLLFLSNLVGFVGQFKFSIPKTSFFLIICFILPCFPTQDFKIFPRISHFTCTFDDGTFCGWRPWLEVTGEECTWILHTKDLPDTPTLKYQLEFHANTCNTTSDRNSQQIAGLVSPLLETTNTPSQCFRMYYYMTGSDGMLWVTMVPPGYDPNNDTFTDSDVRTEFLRKGSQGRQWHSVSITIDSHGATTYQLVIWAARGVANTSLVYLDNLEFFFGACLADYNQCDFETSLCGYSVMDSLTGDFSWRRSHAGNYSTYDHTFFAVEGRVLVANGVGSPSGSQTRIQSSFYNLTGGSADHCVTFWYEIAAPSINGGQLSVSITATGFQPLIKNWVAEDGFESSWEYAAVPVRNLSGFFVTFEALNGENSVFFIDDIAVTVEPCQKAWTCSFEDGLCGWVSKLEDELDWVRITPELGGTHQGEFPANDTSTESIYGHFMGVESEDEMRILAAHLASPRLRSDGKIWCFKFWHQIHYVTNESGSLLQLLKLVPGETDLLIFTSTISTGGKWVQVKVEIMVSSAVKLVFIGRVQGKLGENIIALDDFLAEEGSCIAATPSTASTTLQPCKGFWCVTSGQCFANYKICNGYVDCSDGSDELMENCPVQAGLDAGEIAGISVGSVAFLAVVVVVGILVWRRRRSTRPALMKQTTYLNFNDVDDDVAVAGAENQSYVLDDLQKNVMEPDRRSSTTG